ncbi:GP1BA-like protein [Mya arenaria]|uniref:GP1BA-like protein n=1 Tax=Mya arenaria TaxID=6604 RepID=A0ABY7DUK7_MYAAR|nr:GP1BA-like protein [Mya arenaria]
MRVHLETHGSNMRIFFVLALIILSASILKVRADYPCVCNYNVETPVYGQASADGAPIGYMYEFDCKPVGQVHGSHSGFTVIQFEHKYGYLASDNNVNTQTCPGDYPDGDLVRTTTKAHSHATNGHTSTTSPSSSVTPIPTTTTPISTTSTTPTPMASTTPTPTTSTTPTSTTSTSTTPTSTTSTTPTPTTSTTPTPTTSTTPTPTTTSTTTTPIPTTTTPKPTTTTKKTTTTTSTTPIPTTPSTEAPSTPYRYWLMTANVTGTPLQYVGIGYNLLTGNPELTPDTGMLLDRRILQLTGSQNSVREASYSTSPSCNRSEATFLVHGGKSLQAERLTRVNISASHPSSVQTNALMGNSDFNSRARLLSDGSQVYFDRTTTCKQGSVRYQGNALRPEGNYTVSRNFAGDVCRLPAVFDPKNATEYMQFLDNWGTSVIMTADLGTKSLERYSQSLSGLTMTILETDPSLLTHSGPFMGYTSSLTVDENRYLSSSIARQHHTSSRTDGTLASPVVTRIDVISITDVISKAYFGPILDELTAEGICTDTIYGSMLTAIADNVRRALEQYPKVKESTGQTPLPSIVDHALQIPVTWPLGNYGLMKTSAGCPGAKVSWQSGWRHYDTEDIRSNNGYSSDISQFLAGCPCKSNNHSEFAFQERRTLKCGYNSTYGPSIRPGALRREVSDGVRNERTRTVRPLGR